MPVLPSVRACVFINKGKILVISSSKVTGSIPSLIVQATRFISNAKFLIHTGWTVNIFLSFVTGAEPTDWDTAATTSKETVSGHKVVPPRFKKLQEGYTQFPVSLPSVKKFEQDSPSVEYSAAKFGNSKRKKCPAETSQNQRPLTLCSFAVPVHLLSQPCVKRMLPPRPDIMRIVQNVFLLS